MIKTCLFLSEIATRIRNVTNLDIGLFHKKSKQGGVKVCTPPPPPHCGGGGGGGLNLLINSQKGEGLTGPQMLGRGCWERGGEFSKKEGVVFWSGEG